VGLGVLAALVASLAFVGTAGAAIPELGRCVSAPGTGKYTANSCLVLSKKESTNLFEFEPGAVKNGYTTKGAAATLEGETSKSKISCKASVGSGTYSGTKESKVEKLEFTGCENKAAKVKCQTEAAEGNATEGKINNYPLNGILGKTKLTKAGVLLTGTVPNPFPFGTTPLLAHFECGGKLSGKGANIFVEGSIIGEVTATDKMSLTAKNKFAKNLTTGKQAITNFEGEAEGSHELTSVVFLSETPEIEHSNEVTTTTVTNEEALEIKNK
jgi:hypothetical protein